MSVQAISWVIDYSKQKGGPLTVLIMIANHAHSDGTSAFPSYDTLARESRLSYRQIARIIPLLKKSGELGVIEGGGRNGTHMYSFPLMTKCQDIHGTTGQNVKTSRVANVIRTVKNRKSKEEPNYRAQKPSAFYRDRRLEREDQVNRELMVGAGPELIRNVK